LVKRTYNKTRNINQLHDAILESSPALAATMKVFGNENDTAFEIVYPDGTSDTDIAAIEIIINDHTPRIIPPRQLTVAQYQRELTIETAASRGIILTDG